MAHAHQQSESPPSLNEGSANQQDLEGNNLQEQEVGYSNSGSSDKAENSSRRQLACQKNPKVSHRSWSSPSSLTAHKFGLRPTPSPPRLIIDHNTGDIIETYPEECGRVLLRTYQPLEQQHRERAMEPGDQHERQHVEPKRPLIPPPHSLAAATKVYFAPPELGTPYARNQQLQQQQQLHQLQQLQSHNNHQSPYHPSNSSPQQQHQHQHQQRERERQRLQRAPQGQQQMSFGMMMPGDHTDAHVSVNEPMSFRKTVNRLNETMGAKTDIAILTSPSPDSGLHQQPQLLMNPAQREQLKRQIMQSSNNNNNKLINLSTASKSQSQLLYNQNSKLAASSMPILHQEPPSIERINLYNLPFLLVISLLILLSMLIIYLFVAASTTNVNDSAHYATPPAAISSNLNNDRHENQLRTRPLRRRQASRDHNPHHQWADDPTQHQDEDFLMMNLLSDDSLQMIKSKSSRFTLATIGNNCWRFRPTFSYISMIICTINLTSAIVFSLFWYSSGVTRTLYANLSSSGFIVTTYTILVAVNLALAILLFFTDTCFNARLLYDNPALTHHHNVNHRLTASDSYLNPNNNNSNITPLSHLREPAGTRAGLDTSAGPSSGSGSGPDDVDITRAMLPAQGPQLAEATTGAPGADNADAEADDEGVAPVDYDQLHNQWLLETQSAKDPSSPRPASQVSPWEAFWAYLVARWLEVRAAVLQFLVHYDLKVVGALHALSAICLEYLAIRVAVVRSHFCSPPGLARLLDSD